MKAVALEYDRAGWRPRDRDLRARAYSVVEARALHALAESHPSPEVFARERARILGES